MIYDFAVGRTNPATFPLDAFSRAATRAIERDYAQYTNYPGELGHEGLRTLMAQRESEREGIPVTADRIALTNGSMQAVTLVADALIERRDDIVITEEFTYPGTISTYRDFGIRMLGMPGRRRRHAARRARTRARRPRAQRHTAALHLHRSDVSESNRHDDPARATAARFWRSRSGTA